jgi:hypothetical protein
MSRDGVIKVLEIIASESKLQQELTKKETIEEVYEYLTSISDGYTIDELKEFLLELLKSVANVPEEQLEKTSGGIQLNKKTLSTMLAALTVASPLVGAVGGETIVQQLKNNIASTASVVGGFGATLCTLFALSRAQNQGAEWQHQVEGLQQQIGAQQAAAQQQIDAQQAAAQQQIDAQQATLRSPEHTTRAVVRSFALKNISSDTFGYGAAVDLFVNNKFVNTYTPKELKDKCVVKLGMGICPDHTVAYNNIIPTFKGDVTASMRAARATRLVDSNGKPLTDAAVLNLDTTDPRELTGYKILYHTTNNLFFPNWQTLVECAQGSDYMIPVEAMAITLRFAQYDYLFNR